jgi:hypothetical protein
MKQRRLPYIRPVLLLLCLLATGRSNPPQDTPAPAADLWSVYRIGGQSVGYIRETTSALPGGGAKTQVRMLIVINRLGNKVEIQADSGYEESADGALRKVRCESSASRQKTLVEAEIADSRLTLKSRTGDRSYEHAIEYAGRLLGPEAARRQSAEKLRAAGDTCEYRTFSPELQGITKISSRVLAREEVELAGRKVPALKVEQTIEGYPAKRTVWLDGEGRTLRQTEPGPFGVSEVVRADRATALAAAGGGELRGEMYAQTLGRSNVRLPSPRSLGRVRVRLVQKDRGLGWPEFEGNGQTVIAKESGSLTLDIRRPEPAPRASRPVADSAELHDFLAANAVLQSDDPEVRRVAREVVGAETDVAKAALKLRDWVHRNMRFDLGIAVAPASEVVRNRGGTCIAYSVLLASLLRAEGIPSRVVMGSVYVAGIWGGHAWVEYRAGDHWVPIDAAIPSPGACDAARLACFRSALRDGVGPHMGSLLQLYGNVDVLVTEYDLDGKTTTVPADARPFLADGDVYRNPWLGVALEKPAGFRFGKMDAVYPETAVVELLGPKGEVVRLSQESVGGVADPGAEVLDALRERKLEGSEAKRRVAGREAVVVGRGRKAGLAFADRADVWVLTVEAENAPQLLDEVAARLRLAPPAAEGHR